MGEVLVFMSNKTLELHDKYFMNTIQFQFYGLVYGLISLIPPWVSLRTGEAACSII